LRSSLSAGEVMVGADVRTMRLSWTYRWVAVLSVLLMASGITLLTTGEAWAAGHSKISAILSFDGNQAELTVPVPACPSAKPSCSWMLIVNEPDGHTLVGWAEGNTGTLKVTLPELCGVVQADAEMGKPWHARGGIRETLDDCHSGSSTTTTSSTTTSTTSTTTSTTTTTSTSTSTTVDSTTTTADGPKVAAATSTTSGGSGALPFTGATSQTAAGGKGGDTLTSSEQLPYTGADIRPLLILGVALILLGGFLITTVESRRRLLRRATAVRMENLKQGARRTSDWFLGL
jgi:hypothetical protein